VKGPNTTLSVFCCSYLPPGVYNTSKSLLFLTQNLSHASSLRSSQNIPIFWGTEHLSAFWLSLWYCISDHSCFLRHLSSSTEQLWGPSTASWLFHRQLGIVVPPFCQKNLRVWLLTMIGQSRKNIAIEKECIGTCSNSLICDHGGERASFNNRKFQEDHA
jgi:hypothetical protein